MLIIEETSGWGDEVIWELWTFHQFFCKPKTTKKSPLIKKIHFNVYKCNKII